MLPRAACLLVLLSCAACGAAPHPPAPPPHPDAVSIRPETRPQPLATAQKPEARAEVSLPESGPNPEARPASRRGKPPRSRPLLVTEIQGLEALAAHTPADAKDHPVILRRIANDYVELSCAAWMAGDRSTELTARRKAKAAFEQLEAAHPGAAPNDEVLFFIAQLYEQSGDETSARETYHWLARGNPTSRLVPAAYVAVGDLYYDEAEALHDPARRLEAKHAYVEALERTRPLDGVDEMVGYASYRLAWVLEKDGDRTGAIAAFHAAIDFASSHADRPDAARVGTAARADLIALGAP